jgi:hypothetical protein
MALFSADIETMDDLFMHTLQRHLLCRKADPEGAADDDRQGQRRAVAFGLRAAPVGNRRPCRAAGGCVPHDGQGCQGGDCPAIDGIIKEANEIAGDISDPEVLDAALAAAAQAVEHYEITRYGTLIAWSKELGHQDAADLLGQTLEEEKETDAKLTKLAEERLNEAA